MPPTPPHAFAVALELGAALALAGGGGLEVVGAALVSGGLGVSADVVVADVSVGVGDVLLEFSEAHAAAERMVARVKNAACRSMTNPYPHARVLGSDPVAVSSRRGCVTRGEEHL